MPEPEEKEPKQPEPKKESVPDSWEDDFTHPRIKALNTRAQTAESKLAEIEAAQAKAEEEALAKREEWKTLAEKREAELSAERLNNTRLKVAVEMGIPTAMVDRLRGNTEEEIKADAQSLKELLKPPEGPGNQPAPKGGAALMFDLANATPDKIREKAADLIKGMTSG